MVYDFSHHWSLLWLLDRLLVKWSEDHRKSIFESVKTITLVCIAKPPMKEFQIIMESA